MRTIWLNLAGVILILGTVIAIPLQEQVNLSVEGSLLRSKPFIKYQSKNENIKNDTFLTKVDHFNPQTNNNRVRFPYLFNDEFFEYGAPIFIYINDAGTMTTEWLQHGLMYDIARDLNALLLTTDYRYFGEHIPTPSASFDDLAFLTVEQTLADIAYLITNVKQQLQSPYSRVVLWGSGDGGTLATLARQKFPHLINGAWSSSGAYAIDVITFEPFDHLSFIIREHGGEECAENVAEAFASMAQLVTENNGASLQESLNLCEPLDTSIEANIAFFFSQQILFIADYISRLHIQGLQDFCADMTAQEDGLAAFGAWLRQSQEPTCLTVPYSYYIGMGTMQEWGQPGTVYGLRQGYYFLCTQFGMFTLTSNNTLFGNQVSQEFHYNMCHDVLGEQYESQLLVNSVDAINSAYGRLNPNPINVVFTNGQLDPWFNHGIQEVPEGNRNTIAWNIPGHGKSADLTSISDLDSEFLARTKQSIREMVEKFVEIHV